MMSDYEEVGAGVVSDTPAIYSLEGSVQAEDVDVDVGGAIPSDDESLSSRVRFQFILLVHQVMLQ